MAFPRGMLACKPQPRGDTMADADDDYIDRSEPERAIAYFAKAIALVLFACLAAGIAVGLGTASRGSSWVLVVGGLVTLVLIWLAIANYLDGNRLLKR